MLKTLFQWPHRIEGAAAWTVRKVSEKLLYSQKWKQCSSTFLCINVQKSSNAGKLFWHMLLGSLHHPLELHSDTVFAFSSLHFLPSFRDEDWYDCASDMSGKAWLCRLQGLFLCAIWTSGLSPPAHRLRCVYWGAEGSSRLCPVSSQRVGAHLAGLHYSYLHMIFNCA